MFGDEHPFAPADTVLDDGGSERSLLLRRHQVGTSALEHLVEANNQNGVPEKPEGDEGIVEFKPFDPHTTEFSQTVDFRHTSEQQSRGKRTLENHILTFAKRSRTLRLRTDSMIRGRTRDLDFGTEVTCQCLQSEQVKVWSR